jgi:hypothetical protein
MGNEEMESLDGVIGIYRRKVEPDLLKLTRMFPRGGNDLPAAGRHRASAVQDITERRILFIFTLNSADSPS